MKLDNRPKKLLVKGPSAEQLQAVRDWYEVHFANFFLDIGIWIQF